MNKQIVCMIGLVVCLICSGAVVGQNKKIKIIQQPVTFGFRESGEGRDISAIIIHSSYNALDKDSFSVSGVIEEYRRYKVSPHYLIDRSGNIYQLVKEQNIAFHAGKSKLPNGNSNVNGCSIGIEVINTLHCSPNEVQYKALNRLIGEIKSKYKIKYILGHKDIAPGRKTDPWKFDSRKIE